jgi:predicted acyl esterase
MKRWKLATACCQLAALVHGERLFAQGPVDDSAFVRDTNVAIRMRDGVVLRADIWRPSPEGGGSFPVLVYRTPYDKTEAAAAQSTARKAVQRGYAVVMQDVRGRHASGGEFLAYQQEGRDGYDTIEWAATQPWSNGSVGTFGLSYPGAVQWLAALENPPHLKAMVPAMTFASPNQFWYSNGVWDLSWIGWIYTNIAPDRRRRLGLPPGAPWDSVRDPMRRTLPLSAVKGLEQVAPWYYEWLRHPPYDPWWDWAEIRGKYDRTSAAILSFSGWHDEAYGPHGATANFAGLAESRAGGPLRAGLIIGPWTHGVPRPGRTSAGARDFGIASSIDYDETVLRWMDRYVRAIDNGVDRAKPVRVFVMGSNRWIESDAWPFPTRTDTLILQRPGSSTLIVSDHDFPVVDPHANRSGAQDYRAFAERRDMAVFETAPLERDLTVVGAMRAELSISADAADTDIWVKVYDVAPDGTAFNLMSPGLDVVRASYRDATLKRELLKPGQVVPIRLSDLLTANTFKKGHRVRVVVMTSFTPHFSRSLHTSELETVSAKGGGRDAGVRIHHSARYPFRLILPVLPSSSMLSGSSS